MAEYVVGYTDDLDPTHVRERITRCRDCIHYSDEIGGYCELLEFANTDMADGFCSWGSPREEH